MKMLARIIAWFFGCLFLLLAGVLILLDEPIYSIEMLLLGLLVCPPAAKIIDKLINNAISKKPRWGIVFCLVVIMGIDIGTLGRAENLKVETSSSIEIAQLSSHKINNLIINGLDYYFIDKGEGEVIFLLHGFPDMASTWDKSIEELSNDYRVIAPFLRGYYPTGIPKDGDYSVKTIANDIVKLAEQLQIEQFHIVGQDWGASVAYATANLAPEKVTRVATIAIPHPSLLEVTPELLFAGRHFILFAFKNWSVRYTRQNNFEYIDTLYQRWSPDFREFQTSADNIKETFQYAGRLEAALGYYWSLFEDQSNVDAKTFYEQSPRVPVLFLGGENDRGVTKAFLNGMEKNMPQGSKVVLFRNAGHFLHHEAFDKFIAELRHFLEIDP